MSVEPARDANATGVSTGLSLVRGTNLVFPASFGVTPARGDALDQTTTLVLDATVGPGSAGEPAFQLRRAAGNCECATAESGPPDFSHEDAGTIDDGGTIVQRAIFQRLNHWRARPQRSHCSTRSSCRTRRGGPRPTRWRTSTPTRRCSPRRATPRTSRA